MTSVKVAITLEQETLRRVDSLLARRIFPNRSRAIQTALREKLDRVEAARSPPSASSSTRNSSRRSPRKASARMSRHGPTLRGEIRWADLNPVRGHEQAGNRPVLILSHDIFNARSGTVIAVALTSQPQTAGFPLTLELKVASLRKPTWAKISQIRTLSVERIGKRPPRIAPTDVAKVIEGLNEILAAKQPRPLSARNFP